MGSDPIRIVISYRRRESAGHAGHLHADLVRRFGEGRVFLDIDSIEPGLNFRKVIEDAIVGSDVLIALIGRDWTTTTDADGVRKLDKLDDPLRFEVELAMRSAVRVVPVLVQGAEMPAPNRVPPSLAEFCELHAIEITDRRWGEDVDALERVLDKIAREKADRLAAPDTATIEAEHERQAAAERDAARRREEAVFQQTLRERLEEARLRQRDLEQQLENERRKRWLIPVGVLGAIATVALGAVLVAALVSRTGGGSVEKTVQVPGRAMWTDTGITLAQGDRVTIAASGTIDTHQPDPARSSGPEGKAGETNVAANIVQGFGHGGLIGRIGDGQPRGIGRSVEFTADTGGRLYLGINDWNFETNAGAFTVMVTVQR
ncbi:MAG: toll/interleukin-1 receptor domain-containing protein [Acidimicrobiales bacterium]